MESIINVRQEQAGVALLAAREIIPSAYTTGSTFGDGVTICCNSRFAGQNPTGRYEGRGTLSLMDDARIAVVDAIA